MRRILFGLLLGLIAAGIFGCAKPRREEAREEVLESSEQTIKGDWEEQMPGK